MIEGLASCFTGLEDPRETRRCDHQLVDILAIAVCAVVACAESGPAGNSVYGRAVEPQPARALVKRSPKRTANWALAIAHPPGGILHSFSARFKTRKSSFIAASSVGK